MRRICMPLTIGLCTMDLYATNYWIVCDGVVCYLLLDCMGRICMPLIIGLYATDLNATNYWIIWDGFVCLLLFVCDGFVGH